MKEKIKKILKWTLNNWRTFLEIGVVVWAINGMWRVITFEFFGYRPELLKLYGRVLGEGVNIFWVPLLFYLLSAILILYLLRRKDKPKSTL